MISALKYDKDKHMKVELGFFSDYLTALTGIGMKKRKREQDVADIKRAAAGNPGFNLLMHERDRLAVQANGDPEGVHEAYTRDKSLIVEDLRRGAELALAAIQAQKSAK